MILSSLGVIAGKGNLPMDVDAQAFITAASITDSTQQSAITQLVADLKTANIWLKMKAIYPFIGGTASSHKYNLKDPRDLDAAYRLNFSGGMNHDSNGLVPNGTTAYATTFLKPSDMSASSVHLSYYSRTNVAKGIDLGSYLSTVLAFYSKYDDGNSYLYLNTGGSSGLPGGANTQAFFLANRNSSTSAVLFRNTTKIINATKNVEIPNSVNITLCGLNFNGTVVDLTNKPCSFSSIGDGLTDAEALAFYNAVQAYQTTLGRQV